MPKLEFHEVDSARWGDFECLFESRGGPKSCWCMVWRAGAKTNKGVDRKFAIRRYVSNETPIGLLGYSEGEPVAWCSIAPRPTYRDSWRPEPGWRITRTSMVVGLLLHSSRLAWTRTDQTNHRSSGAERRETWCYCDRSVSRRSKLPQLSLYGIRTDVRIGRILRGWPSWNTSACLAPRIAQIAWSACDPPRTYRDVQFMTGS